jgi:hypothetical protein
MGNSPHEPDCCAPNQCTVEQLQPSQGLYGGVAMNRRAKLPKPSKINRKLELSKETVVQLTDGKAQTPAHKCTYLGTGCPAYTC